MKYILFLFALLCGCDRELCSNTRDSCMDVCKEHVTTPTIVSLEANQQGKVECLRFCYDEYRTCVKNGGSP